MPILSVPQRLRNFSLLFSSQNSIIEQVVDSPLLKALSHKNLFRQSCNVSSNSINFILAYRYSSTSSLTLDVVRSNIFYKSMLCCLIQWISYRTRDMLQTMWRALILIYSLSQLTLNFNCSYFSLIHSVNYYSSYQAQGRFQNLTAKSDGVLVRLSIILCSLELSNLMYLRRIMKSIVMGRPSHIWIRVRQRLDCLLSSEEIRLYWQYIWPLQAARLAQPQKILLPILNIPTMTKSVNARKQATFIKFNESTRLEPKFISYSFLMQIGMASPRQALQPQLHFSNFSAVLPFSEQFQDLLLMRSLLFGMLASRCSSARMATSQHCVQDNSVVIPQIPYGVTQRIDDLLCCLGQTTQVSEEVLICLDTSMDCFCRAIRQNHFLVPTALFHLKQYNGSELSGLLLDYQFHQHMDQDTQNKQEVDTQTLYQLLDLTKQATTQQIKKAFRRKAIKQHPDKGGDPEKFRQLKEASQILSNPETRQLYDQYGMEGVKAGGDPNGGGDFMSMFFGGGNKQKGPKKCKPKLIPVPVTLEKVFEGGSVNIEVQRVRPCDKCQGKGGANAKTCSGCNGQRMTQKLVNLGRGMYTQTMAPCDKCEGQGVLFQQEDRCKQCQGKRMLPNKKKFDIPIDPGVPHEHDYVMSGEADEYPGALAGDLYFRIQIEDHPEFVRKGADILYVKKISLLQALTGVCFDLKLLDGTTIKIATPKGVIISNDQKKVVKGKGMPFYKDSMSKGNLIILFQIEFPHNKQIDAKEYKSLADIFNQPMNAEAEIEEPQSNYLEDLTSQKDEEWEDEEEEGQQKQQGGMVCQPQ